MPPFALASTPSDSRDLTPDCLSFARTTAIAFPASWRTRSRVTPSDNRQGELGLDAPAAGGDAPAAKPTLGAFLRR